MPIDLSDFPTYEEPKKEEKDPFADFPLYEDVKKDDQLLREIQEYNKAHRSNFVRGLVSGGDQTEALGFGGASLVGSALSKMTGGKVGDDLSEWGMEGYRRNMREAEENPIDVENIQDIQGVGDALSWASGQAGRLAPTALLAIGSGGTAALAEGSLKIGVEQLAKKFMA